MLCTCATVCLKLNGRHYVILRSIIIELKFQLFNHGRDETFVFDSELNRRAEWKGADLLQKCRAFWEGGSMGRTSVSHVLQSCFVGDRSVLWNCTLSIQLTNQIDRNSDKIWIFDRIRSNVRKWSRRGFQTVTIGIQNILKLMSPHQGSQKSTATNRANVKSVPSSSTFAETCFIYLLFVACELF